MTDLRLLRLTSAMIKTTTSSAAPAYMSLTALSTFRGGLPRSNCT
jgi:hypothetical protein